AGRAGVDRERRRDPEAGDLLLRERVEVDDADLAHVELARRELGEVLVEPTRDDGRRGQQRLAYPQARGLAQRERRRDDLTRALPRRDEGGVAARSEERRVGKGA